MFKKKDIDIASIMRESFLEAKKEHGLLKEEEITEKQPSSPGELKFKEEFNPEKDLQFMQIVPKLWGRAKTVEASHVDAIVKGVIGDSKGIQGYKAAIKKLNTVLGKTPNIFSLPTKATDEQINVSALDVFNSLQLNSLIHSIIYAQDPNVAGKMFEGLVSRMVGGKTSLSDTIQDLVDDSGKFISLKVIDPGATTIQGSFYNLARGIALSEGGITYLVCLKSTKENPFILKTFSFNINKHNYFNFLLKKSGQLSVDDIIRAEKTVIVSDKPPVSSGEKSRFIPKEYDVDEKKIEVSLINYAETLGAAGDEIQKSNYLKNIVDQNNKLVDDAKNYVKQDMWEKYIKPLSIEKVANKTSKKAINSGEFARFRGAIKNFADISKNSEMKMRFFEDQSEIDKLSNETSVEDTQDAESTMYLKNAAKYNQMFIKIVNLLTPVINFAEGIEKTLKELSRQELQTSKELGSQYRNLQASNISVKTAIDEFFKKFSGNNLPDKASGAGSLDIGIAQAKQLALETDGEYDDTYEELIVEGGVIFNNAKQSTEILKKYIIPIFKANHEMLNGLKSYYIADQMYGMVHAKNNVEILKDEIEKEAKEQRTASQITTGNPKQQVAENVNKDLTKHWTEVMLEELLK